MSVERLAAAQAAGAPCQKGAWAAARGFVQAEARRGVKTTCPSGLGCYQVYNCKGFHVRVGRRSEFPDDTHFARRVN